MNKKEKKRHDVRVEVEKAIVHDEENRRIQFAATNPIKEVLNSLRASLRGLDEEAVFNSRSKWGQ